jgi:hypothetical protein
MYNFRLSRHYPFEEIHTSLYYKRQLSLRYFKYPLHSDFLTTNFVISRDADKSLAFPISYFLNCNTTKTIFLRWVKEVRKTKSYVCGAQGGICKYVSQSRSLLFTL